MWSIDAIIKSVQFKFQIERTKINTEEKTKKENLRNCSLLLLLELLLLMLYKIWLLDEGVLEADDDDADDADDEEDGVDEEEEEEEDEEADGVGNEPVVV